MSFWKTFIDADFNNPEENYKVREKLMFKCSECGTNSYIQVCNLKKQLKKLGTHLCWSCSARRATFKAKDKYKATMLAKYGTENPNQVPEIKEKIKKTNIERYGAGGSIAKARKAFKEKHGVDNPGLLPQTIEKNKKENNGLRECTSCLIMLPIINFALKGKYHNSKCKECQKIYAKKYMPEYSKKRRKLDPNFKLATNLRSRISNVLKNNPKVGSAIKDLDCSLDFLKEYIESKFQPGMTWENYGTWHIDHIKPLSAFTLTNREEFLKACHYTNLQPLWAEDNIRKGGIKKT